MPPAPRPTPRLVSVVIPMRDAEHLIGDQLAALAGQDHDGGWEVVIADNGSTDASVAAAERHIERLGLDGRVIKADGQRSASHARNAGARAARGDFLAFTDADDVVRPEWLRSMAEAARHGDLVAGAVGVDALAAEPWRSWHPISPRDRALRTYRFLSYASGLNTGVWADVFERIGGYDEETVIGEDVEFSWRAQLAEHRLEWSPDTVVEERLRGDLARATRQHFAYGAAAPHLYRRFRHAGMTRVPAATVLRTWAWIGLAWPAALLSPRMRGRWALETALAAGRIVGSARNRVLFL